MKIIKNFNLLLIVLITLSSCGGDNSTNGVGYPARETRSGDWGYVNADGEVVIDFSLNEKPSVMTEGIGFYLKQKDKEKYVVYIDKNDNEYKTNYVQSLSFNEGLALVTTATGKLTYIDKEYNEVLVLDNIIEAGYFSEGLAKYMNEEGKWGFINKQGEKVIPAKFDYVESFIDGYSMVRNYDNNVYYRGIINKNGEFVVYLTDKYTTLYVAKEGLFFYSESDGEVGFLNEQGEQVLTDDDWDIEYTYFNDGYCCVREGREFGLVDKNGDYKIKVREDYPIVMSEKLYVYEKDREYGYKDIEQNVKISAEYDKATPFIGKGAWVKDNKDWVFIDKKGKFVNDLELYKIDVDTDIWKKLAVGLPAIDLNKTIESNFVNIDEFISEVINIDKNKIFGAILNSSNPEQVIDYITSKSFFTNKKSNNKQTNTKEYIKNKLSSRSSRISTYDLYGYSDFDKNLSYYIKYSFNGKVLEKSDKPNKYKFNNTTSVNRITLKIDLNNKAYSKDEEILEKIKSIIHSSGFKEDNTLPQKSNNKYYSKNDYDKYQILGIRHSNSSITLDFNFDVIN